MPSTMDVRDVVKVIKEKLDNAIFDHDLDLLANVYNSFTIESGDDMIVAFRDYFIVEED